MNPWDLQTLRIHLSQLEKEFGKYVSDYEIGRLDSEKYVFIQNKLVELFLNGISFFQPINLNRDYFYFMRILGKDFMKNFSSLNKEEVDAFFNFLYKLNVLNLHEFEFERFHLDVLHMLRYYMAYFDSQADIHIN